MFALSGSVNQKYDLPHHVHIFPPSFSAQLIFMTFFVWSPVSSLELELTDVYRCMLKASGLVLDFLGIKMLSEFTQFNVLPEL